MAIIILALKLVSLWKSAKGDQKAWFIVLGILNTVGILEIIYLLFFMPKEEKKVL
jgi:methionyl-tRNA synthetase